MSIPEPMARAMVVTDDGAAGGPVPLNEDARLNALLGLNILDTPPDERFDRIARLAAKHFGAPESRITFVDSDRTWYKACYGTPSVEGPRDNALCSRTVMGDAVMVSCDLSKDHRFSAMPQVMGPPHLRFYAGAPITLEDGPDAGQRVGSLCVFDVKPRMFFSDDDKTFLADLAQLVVHELELHKQIASRDTSLKEAARQVDIARGAKERFMRVVSHELKTPLSHVVGFGEILANQRLGPLGNESYEDYAHHLFQSARRLEGLIERVLTYSSADAGELRLSEADVATGDILERCMDLANFNGKTGNVAISRTIEAGAPATLYVDDVQMVEVVVLLLENAISFSPAGETVDLTIGRSEDGGLSLCVLDRGPGLGGDASTGVAIRPFRQGDERRARRHEGMGLGLPIARALIELHGGTLTLNNRQGGGAIAQAVLPAHRCR